MRLLLVDDDFDLSETLKELFEMHQFLVDTAASGQDALARLKSTSYDLILLDWQLPDMSGLEVCKAYRRADGLGKILLLTGMRDQRFQELGLEAGASAFLAKPFTIEQLFDCVKQLLKTPDSPPGRH